MTKIRSSRSVATIGIVLVLGLLGVLIVFSPNALGIRGPQRSGEKATAAGNQAPTPAPIDPQIIKDQADMTWDDYRPIPGIDWADPARKPQREFHMALVAVDFPDQPFVVTLPKHSDLFGNPQIDPVGRDQVPQFYADFFIKPGAVNHGHTINGYWMEQSRGRFGITQLDTFGPYRLPKPLWEYGLNEFGQNSATPDGSRANGRLEPDCDALWTADKGDIRKNYDAVLRIYAGYDETGVWMEFGEMKFQTKEDIPAEWGNPDPMKPRWVVSRYVPWTSWRAGAQQWGLSSIRQGENSGTITHELGHFAFSIGDNNNNPYAQPYRRAGSGPWDMMDRGSFNGPGGPHNRWEVPATAGASMPAGLMLRNKLLNGFVALSQVLQLNRNGLAKSGAAVADVTAREVDPLPHSFAGILVKLDGEAPRDRTPVDDPAANPLSPGNPTYNFYSLEVVQRIGYDSFCPDSGVLIAKNKDGEGTNGGPNGFNCFSWVIDAHPEDIRMVDYIKPNGQKVMRTVADYRQLNDALFHAGLNSGSQFEWEDPVNRLHFYVIDLHKDARGILSYTVGVRSLDAAGPQLPGVQVAPPAESGLEGAAAELPFVLQNTGKGAATDPSLHPQDAGAYLENDIYRLTVSVTGQGWSAELRNALAAAKFGASATIPVYVTRRPESSVSATVTLTARSESDPTKTATATCLVKAPIRR
jgi:M6 family metalloprotease-like protein